MDKYTKKRSKVVSTIDYKYRIHHLLQTFGDDEVEKIILGNLLMELNLDYTQLKAKLYARVGEVGRNYTFSLGEIHIVLYVINQFRPFRKQIALPQLYHPDIKVGG